MIPQRYLSEPTNEYGEKSIWNSVSTSARTEKWPRGFANKITARLLCPIDYLHAFDANPAESVLSLIPKPKIGCLLILSPKPRTIEKLKNGSFSRLDREGVPKFPLFMYDEDMIEPGKLTNGLFRGQLLVDVSSSLVCTFCP